MFLAIEFWAVVKVVLTANLQKYYPERQFQAKASSVQEILSKMDSVRPLFTSYILEDDKTVRRHVNLFLNGQLLPKNDDWNKNVKDGDTVHIMQALSGG
jgi:molybdopterin synthase sulfur carrier subunit